MSIHKTPAGTLRVYYSDGDRKRSRNFETKAEAEIFEAEVKRKKRGGLPLLSVKEAPTLEEFGIDWLSRRTDLAPKTLKLYADSFEKHVCPYLGHLRVHPSELRPVVLDRWLRERDASGVGASVLKVAYGTLNQILNHAVMPSELLESNPLQSVKAPRPIRKQAEFVSPQEVEALRRHFKAKGDLRSVALISVLAYVGIRPQDALALEWGDIEQDQLWVVKKNVDGQIYPGSKTGLAYRRRVTLPSYVAADLENLRDSQGASAGTLIFPRPKDGKPWREYDYANWRRRFKVVVKQLGIKMSRPYDLRHTCASILASAGWNHLEIAEQLGHSPATSVRLYQHLLRVGNGPRPTVDQQIRDVRLADGGNGLATDVAE